MYNIMIVDDEEMILKSMKRIFNSQNDLNVEYFSSPFLALERCRTEAFDVIMSDYRMPEQNGVDFLIETRVSQPDAIRLILSANVDMGSLAKAVNDAGIDKYLAKPWENHMLIETVYEAARKRTKLLENRILSDMLRIKPEMMLIHPKGGPAYRIDESDPLVNK